eukprot:GHVU01027955.1.p1 GENE.GHVU01027955.1~~GHVU01027955.1.p1  ORF type:complete len:429 (-),score=44.61 GHVU01027955.1:1020-2273(-)
MATEPGEILHMDFLSLCKGVGGWYYILVLKDNWSGFVRLVKCLAADAATAAAALADWCHTYTTPSWLISDGGSHFKNEVLRELTETHRIKHHITLAGCPWSNGTVENMCGFAQRVFRVLLSSMKGKKDRDWPELVDWVTTRVNDVPYRRDGITARSCFLNPMLGKRRRYEDLYPLTPVMEVPEGEVPAALDKAWNDFHEALNCMHQLKTEKRAGYLVRLRTPEDRKVYLPNKLERGAYVFCAREDRRKEGEKLRLRWVGPKQITEVLTPFIYRVKDLVDHRERKVHVQRISFYCEEARGDMTGLRDAALGKYEEYEAERLLGARWNTALKRAELLVEYQGFEEEAPTWEPAHVICFDVPDMVQAFLDNPPKDTPAPMITSIRGILRQEKRKRPKLPVEDPPEATQDLPPAEGKRKKK